MKIFFKIVILVSLLQQTTNPVALGSVDRSSPEESEENNLPSLRLISGRSLPSYQGFLTHGVFEESLLTDEELAESFFANSFLNTSAFPYQVDPVSVVVAAAITLAVQSLKETGRIDPAAIGRLLDSTDLYAGWIGSGVAAYTKYRAQGAIVGASRRILPERIKAIGQHQLTKILGNVVNGLSYTIAVGGGFEYFSQFWKLATRGSDRVRRVSDLVGAEWKEINPVLTNLLNYVADPNVRKRISSSVYNHRILTYEFIATNVGLYLGIVIGARIAASIGPQTPKTKLDNWKRRFADYFGRVLGGITGGVMVQLTPEVVRIKVNEALIDWKIRRHLEGLDQDIDRLQEGLANRLYPPYHDSGIGGFIRSQTAFHHQDLDIDLERISRAKDMVQSLYLQKMFLYESQAEAFEGLVHVYELVDAVSRISLETIGVDYDLKDELSIYDLAHNAGANLDVFDRHYAVTIGAHQKRWAQETERLNAFISEVSAFQASHE